MKKISIPFKNYRIELYNKPGKWMANDSLLFLQQRLGNIAEKRLGKRPEFSFFGDVKHLSNKLVLICSGRKDGLDYACSILSYLGKYQKNNVIHLGAVYSTIEDKGVLRILYGFAGIYLIIKNWLYKRIYFTSLTHTPKIFGVVDENFEKVFPNLNPDAKPSKLHLKLKEIFINTYLKEWNLAAVPEITSDFIIKGFRIQNDGSMLYPDSILTVPKHRKIEYNERCLNLINLEDGDEIFQAGYTDGLLGFIKKIFRLTSAAA